ncbi:MAG: hypothetical protein QOH47_2200 [Sphingomonadales bacterium]|jgi:hypothetical protein|nr:hypothetical protein [Sphingomonadales bacterium]
MNKLICLAAALAMPASALAQEPCGAPSLMGPRVRNLPRWSAAVMEPPVLGETRLTQGNLAAARNLVLARQAIVLAPRIRYLAAPIVLTDATGRDLAHSVPLGRGAPITFWRDQEGIKQCAIGWQNGLFGGAAGDGHMRWVCLEDRNGDGRYDNAWRPFTRSMGLSFSRLDIPIDPPVATLAEPPADAQVRTNARATLGGFRLERVILVTRIDAASIRIEERMGPTGRGGLIVRTDVPLAAPAERTLSGVTVRIIPAGPGAATLIMGGAFNANDIRIRCDGSQIEIGEVDLSTQFGFPDW